MPTKAIMTLGITNDKGNVRMQHDRKDFVVVM
jgi:hypothetical protein